MFGRGKAVLRCRESTSPVIFKAASTVKTTGLIEGSIRAIGVIISIHKSCAMGDVGMLVVNNVVAMPVISPVGPPPAKAAKETDSKA